MNQELWQRIQAFDFDRPFSEYGFSTRLAKENYWTENFTKKAIEEYKKFMYLAATSDQMVSPSPIIDAVWHQHLVFTGSYADFGEVLGKVIQHLPSTRNKDDKEKFIQAKERTQRLYKEVFGEAPQDIWTYTGMFESLNLAKARWKLRSMIIGGILAAMLLFSALYFLLFPVYARIDNPYFLYVYMSVAFGSLILLEVINRIQLGKMLDKFDKESFVFDLTPLELVYLNKGRLADVIHGSVAELAEEKTVVFDNSGKIYVEANPKVNNIREFTILETIYYLCGPKYPVLFQHLMVKPILANVKNSMDAFKKYLLKSRAFHRLFYLNFSLLALLIIFGSIRILTGYVREKPIVLISVFTGLFAALSIAYLYFLTVRMTRQVVPRWYKQWDIPGKENQQNWQWQFFLLGAAAITTGFTHQVNEVDQNLRYRGSADGSTGGSDSGSGGDGASCGSSCGGCGGGCGS